MVIKDKMFTQIGNSEYYEGVWYKITNPEALYKEKPKGKYKRIHSKIWELL